MFKAEKTITDPKITRHCNYGTFVSRVDKRSINFTGLAIHSNPSPAFSPKKRSPPKHFPKSSFHIQVEKELEERNKQQKQMEKNLAAKKAYAKELNKRLKTYQSNRAFLTSGYKLCSNLEIIDIPPDYEQMALFRYCFLNDETNESVLSDM